MEEADAISQFQSDRDKFSKLTNEEQVSMLFSETFTLRRDVSAIGRSLDLILSRLDSLVPLGNNSPVRNVIATPPGAQEGQWVPSTSPEQPNPKEPPGAPKDPDRPQRDADAELEAASSTESAERLPGQVVLSEEQFFQLTAMLDRRGPKRDLAGLKPRRTAPKDDSDEDSEHGSEAATDKRQGRRTSMLYQPSLAKGVTATQVSMYRNQPDYDHIVLKHLSVNAVFKFWEAVDLYQMKYGIEINAAIQIEDDVRRTIMAKSDMIDIREFLALTPDKLRRIIQSAMKPTDRSMFAERLEKSLHFWKRDEQPFDVNIETWQRFWDRLLLYKSEFETKYEFLAHENSRNEPKLENKDGGTIKIFLSRLPRAYAENAFRNLSTSKFSSLKDFLDVFYDQAQSHYRMSVKAKELLSFVKPVVRKDQLMETLSESPGEDQDTEETLAGTGAPPKAPNSQLNAFGGLNRGLPTRVPPKPPEAPKAVDKPTAGTPKGPNGCFRALTEGKCTKPNCPFDHSLEVLQSTKDDLLAKLRSDLWRGKVTSENFTP